MPDQGLRSSLVRVSSLDLDEGSRSADHADYAENEELRSTCARDSG